MTPPDPSPSPAAGASSAPSIKDAKAQLRREAMQRRRAAAAAAPDAGTHLRDVALPLALEAADACGPTVSGFWPMGDEIDIRPLMAALADAGHRLCLPVTSDPRGPLTFRLWQPGDALAPARFGTSEPAPTAAEAEPDVLLTPLLLFDRAGGRLGYGGGYYDRTLAALRRRRRVFALGVAYAGQEAGAVPVTPEDEPLDAIATDRGIIRI